MQIEMDSELRYRVVEESEGANPLVFTPFVDFDKLTEASIIDAF